MVVPTSQDLALRGESKPNRHCRSRIDSGLGGSYQRNPPSEFCLGGFACPLVAPVEGSCPHGPIPTLRGSAATSHSGRWGQRPSTANFPQPLHPRSRLSGSVLENSYFNHFHNSDLQCHMLESWIDSRTELILTGETPVPPAACVPPV
jgi:hypothetical protein